MGLVDDGEEVFLLEKYAVEKTKEGHAYLEQLKGEDKRLACEVMDYVEKAALMPEQTIIIELTLLKKFVDGLKVGQDVASVVADPESFANAAIAEIGESVRQNRHLTSLMSGFALSGVLLLVQGLFDLVRALSSGGAVMATQTTLDAGHMLALIFILVAARFFVAGDKKTGYSDAKKSAQRSAVVAVLLVLALAALLLPMLDAYTVVTIQSAYLVLFGLAIALVARLGTRL